MPHQRIVPGDILRSALVLSRRHFALLYPLALVFSLVQAMVAFALRDSEAAGLSTLVGLAAGTFLTGVVAGFVRDAEAGLDAEDEPSAGALFTAIAPQLGVLLLASVLSTIGIVLGLFAFIVPGLWLYTVWAVVAPVVVLERRDVVDALRRSRALVAGNGRDVFLTLLLLILLLLPTAFIALAAIDALGDVGGAFVGVLFSALVTTLTVVAISVLYVRLLDVERSAAKPAPHPGDAWVSTGTAAPGDDDPGSGDPSAEEGSPSDPRAGASAPDDAVPSWPPPTPRSRPDQGRGAPQG